MLFFLSNTHTNHLFHSCFFFSSGKLTKEQIKAGYEALKDIESLIEKKDFGRNLSDACSEFYTRIPHEFG